MPFYLSQAGGGGGNAFEVDKMPVFAGNGGLLANYNQFSYSSDFWNSNNWGGAGGAQVIKSSSGWHTLLNITGKGNLYSVVAPGFGGSGGRVIVKITADGTAYDYDYTLSSSWAVGSTTRVRFGVGNGVAYNQSSGQILFSLTNYPNEAIRTIDSSPVLVSHNSSNIGVFVNPSAYTAYGFPSLPFETSLNIQVYTSIHQTSDKCNYAGAVYTTRS